LGPHHAVRGGPAGTDINCSAAGLLTQFRKGVECPSAPRTQYCYWPHGPGAGPCHRFDNSDSPGDRINNAVGHNVASADIAGAERMGYGHCREVVANVEAREPEAKPEHGIRHPGIKVIVVIRRRIVSYDRRPLIVVVVVDHCRAG
jgi:hypothetical protein